MRKMVTGGNAGYQEKKHYGRNEFILVLQPITVIKYWYILEIKILGKGIQNDTTGRI